MIANYKQTGWLEINFNESEPNLHYDHSLDFSDEDISLIEDFKSLDNIIRISRVSKVTYFDKNFLSKLAAFAHRTGTRVIVVNDFLSGLQLKNIRSAVNNFENINKPEFLRENEYLKRIDASVEIVVIDRLGLILQIFNNRANDELMKAQVGLVYLKYAKGNLVREGDGFTAVKEIYNFNILKQAGKIFRLDSKGTLILF